MTWRPASSTLCKYIATYPTYWGCEKLRLLNSFYRRTHARKLPLSENGRKEKDSAEAVVWKRRGEKFLPVNAVFRFFPIEPTDGLFFLENLPNSSSLFTTFSSMGNPLPAVLRYEPAQAPTRIGDFGPSRIFSSTLDSPPPNFVKRPPDEHKTMGRWGKETG